MTMRVTMADRKGSVMDYLMLALYALLFLVATVVNDWAGRGVI